MHVIPAARVVVSRHPPADPVELSLRHRTGGEVTTRCIADVADRQGGNVTRRQVRRLGFSERVIDGLIEAGWLIVIHRGVFAVGHRPRTHPERWWGAVLACGRRRS